MFKSVQLQQQCGECTSHGTHSLVGKNWVQSSQTLSRLRGTRRAFKATHFRPAEHETICRQSVCLLVCFQCLLVCVPWFLLVPKLLARCFIDLPSLVLVSVFQPNSFGLLLTRGCPWCFLCTVTLLTRNLYLCYSNCLSHLWCDPF